MSHSDAGGCHCKQWNTGPSDAPLVLPLELRTKALRRFSDGSIRERLIDRYQVSELSPHLQWLDQMQTVSKAKKPRPNLSRAAILQAATTIALAGKIEDITIRKLAEQLGASPMAIYRHFENREDIEREIAGNMLRDRYRLSASARYVDWEDSLRGAARTLHDALIAHPILLRSYSDRDVFMSNESLALQEQIHLALTESGLGEAEFRPFARLLASCVIGSVFLALNSPNQSLSHVEKMMLEIESRDQVGLEKYPRLSAAVRASAIPEAVTFETSVNLLIRSIKEHVAGKAPRI